MYRMASSVTSAPIAERLVGHGIWVDAPHLFCSYNSETIATILKAERKNNKILSRYNKSFENSFSFFLVALF